MQTLQHRTTSGDRAARQAAAAIGIKFGEARHAMRKEAEAQQRQLDAAARRRWCQMTPKERRGMGAHRAYGGAAGGGYEGCIDAAVRARQRDSAQDPLG